MAQQSRGNNNAPLNLLSEYKMRLKAPPQNGATKDATLSVGIYRNNPRLVVRTNVPNDKDFGRITAALNTFTFMTLLHLVDRIADGPNDVKEILNNNSDFVAGKKYDAPITVSRVMIGKDKDGVVWIAVTAKDRPMIKFEFSLDEWHFLSHANGDAWTKADASVMVAHGWTASCREIVPMILKDEFVPPEMNNNGGSGGGNRGGRGGGSGDWGGGGRNQRQESGNDGTEDEDIPF